ncbi:hypothetical protein [Clostridium lacusfryxellense]|uniref:hypothetical protein n=1 Tax=Clostridium lacusfryxellense TaxID=205328 RepID=UPI001C0DA737|nr:hypothetical protein [Clostridium lacusfryxellense]MBU3113194.1 hypothetical protein [Clostridium lacusfryxellense]
MKSLMHLLRRCCSSVGDDLIEICKRFYEKGSNFDIYEANDVKTCLFKGKWTYYGLKSKNIYSTITL